MAFLAPLINEQQLDVNGKPLAGGKIWVYLAGTSTPATTYSDKAGLVPNTNPIVLNSLGVNVQGSVWLTGGSAYKFVITDSLGTLQRTIDDVSGVNDTTVAADQWVVYQGVPTYVSATSFTVPGDQTQIFQVGRRVKTTNTGGTAYGTILSSTYSAPNTTVTLGNSSGALDAGLSAVSYGLISPVDTSLPQVYPQGRNLLVNGNFAINQRVYVSGAATGIANQVTLDRWRVVTSGQNLTFGAAAPDRVVTAPAGGIEQIIEAGWIVGGVYALSWTGTATATVNGVAVTNGSQTASLPANTAVTVRFTGGTVGLAQFEPTYVTPYERRPPGVELLLCQREYSKSYAQGTVPGTATSIGADRGYVAVGGSILSQINFPVVMRTAPINIYVWSNNGVAGQWVAFTTGGVATSYGAVPANISDRNATINISVATEVLSSGQWAAETGF